MPNAELNSLPRKGVDRHTTIDGRPPPSSHREGAVKDRDRQIQQQIQRLGTELDLLQRLVHSARHETEAEHRERCFDAIETVIKATREDHQALVDNANAEGQRSRFKVLKGGMAGALILGLWGAITRQIRDHAIASAATASVITAAAAGTLLILGDNPHSTPNSTQPAPTATTVTPQQPAPGPGHAKKPTKPSASPSAIPTPPLLGPTPSAPAMVSPRQGQAAAPARGHGANGQNAANTHPQGRQGSAPNQPQARPEPPHSTPRTSIQPPTLPKQNRVCVEVQLLDVNTCLHGG